MTTWSDAHRRAGVLASELHGDLDTALDRPVDVFGAIRRLGIVLAFAPLGKVSGLYVPESPSRGILLNSGHPRTRQRYTAGHELGHHVFGHTPDFDEDLEESLRRDAAGWSDQEKEAEAFGAWFLMPRLVLRQGMAQLRTPSIRNEFDAYALSLWLGTSYIATVRQLAVARVILSDQANVLARIAPRTIKQSLAGAFAPDDLRNDVWWRDEKHDARELVVRPRDRVVLTLGEVPSSGYSWRFVDVPDQVTVLADSHDGDWESPLFNRPSTDDDLAGQVQQRSFVLEVDPVQEPSVCQIRLLKGQAWGGGGTSSSFDLRLSIRTRLHGIQLSESALALSA